MKFRELAEYFEKLENTSSRLTMTDTLAELFKKLSHDEIGKVLYLLQGRLTPLFVRLDFGMGEKMVIKAVISALSVDRAYFMNEYKKAGDIGLALSRIKEQTPSLHEKNLSILEVYDQLYKLANSGGVGSQETKLSYIIDLVQTLDPLSCRYVVRIPTGTMRLGFSDMTILDAFSVLAVGDKSHRPVIENAYHVRPDLGFIGSTIKKSGVKGLKNVTPQVFTPIIMMRAERLSDASEILKKNPNGLIEPKYDGFRLQIHCKKNGSSKEMTVKLYSRSLDEVTYMYPDIVAGVQKEVVCQNMIFEGEAIGYDQATDSFLPFQETVTRKRKYDIESHAIEVPLKLFVFELLYVDNKSFLNTPFTERREELEKHIKITSLRNEDAILLSPEKRADSAIIIEKEFEIAVSAGLEGIMIKKQDGVYKPGAREWNWIKYKRSYSKRIDDTIDCLVMGYDYGRGKRSDFGIGAFLVGVYDEKTDSYKTIAKIGTGLTDEEWKQIKINADKLKSIKKPALYDVDKMSEPDVWSKPELVVEIRADEITRSPVHTAGLALRFPRLERFREDKRAQEATSLDELNGLFKKQGSK